MNGLSEDDSSDSSNEYLVNHGKSDLNSSFFTKKGSTTVKNDIENDSSDDENFEDVGQTSNIELFTQVLKNLKYSQQVEDDDGNVTKDQLCSNSSTLPKEESKIQEIRREVNDATSSNEIYELLLQGESSIDSSQKKASNISIKSEEDAEVSNNYTIPKDGVNIVLSGTNLMKNKKRKKGQDLQTILRRRLRASEILVEKVGLLCWLAYGFYLNYQINEPEIMAGVLSLISTCNYPKNRIDLTYLEKFTKWFKNVFVFEPTEINDNKQIGKQVLLKILKEKKVFNHRELILLYIAALRALGLNCRLVISLYPPHRVFSNNSSLFKSNSKEQEAKPKGKSNAIKGESSRKNKEKKNVKMDVIQNSLEAKKNANVEAKKRAAEILQSNLQSNKKKSRINTNKESNLKNEATEKSGIKSTGRITRSKVIEQESSVSGLRQLRSRKINVNFEDNKVTKVTDLSLKSDDTKSKYYIKEDSTDSDTEFQPKPKRVIKKNSNSVKKEIPQSSKNTKNNNKKLISSDSETEEMNKTNEMQGIWAEVYLESEESWICASVIDEKIHCVTEIYRKAKKPVLYVVAWNSEGSMKDVTRRYCPQWLTVTRKQRIDEKWWLETLSPWKERNTTISKAEDEMLLQKELEQPLPKSSGLCKGHPLYAIQKHLLKFEALYPPDCVPLGYTSTGDAIYSRHCVHTLYSRETWIRKARVVKPKEEPYKIVTARPKYDKLSGTKLKNLPLELFGEWQTMQYEPPIAKDGIVPRNEYGNVDLYQQCMLPKGTVHINLPGLNRIARKLNIDCAPAVVGFNFGSMGAVPAVEGYVVCSEYEDTLREAWETEQAEAVKRNKEKQDKRVYGNWKKLIRGLLIKKRLAAKYNFSEKGQ